MPMAINISFAADEKRPAICHFNKFDDVAAAAEIDDVVADANSDLSLAINAANLIVETAGLLMNCCCRCCCCCC